MYALILLCQHKFNCIFTPALFDKQLYTVFISNGESGVFWINPMPVTITSLNRLSHSCLYSILSVAFEFEFSQLNSILNCVHCYFAVDWICSQRHLTFGIIDVCTLMFDWQSSRNFPRVLPYTTAYACVTEANVFRCIHDLQHILLIHITQSHFQFFVVLVSCSNLSMWISIDTLQWWCHFIYRWSDQWTVCPITNITYYYKKLFSIGKT